MIRKEKNGLTWLQFENLSQFPYLKHGIFLRHGGHSQVPYSSLNLGDNVGDDPNKLMHNRLKVQAVLDISHIVNVRQVHGKTVLPIEQPLQSVLEADAMITTQRKIGLMITHADCQAAIIYDPKHHILATAHCGWRGSVQNIFAHVVQIMTARGSQPKDILVGISPSLGPCSAQFIHYKTELPSTLWEYQVKPEYFDFWRISHHQLIACGILSKNIEIAEIDTMTSADFFSYRREKQTGRNGTLAALS